MIDLLNPDWGQMSRLAVSGPASRTEGGWSLPTNAGGLSLTAYATGIFRLRLGDADPADYGILTAPPDTPPIAETAETELGWRVSAHGNALTIDRHGSIALGRGERTILKSPGDRRSAQNRRPPPLARLGAEQWFAALALGSGDAVYGLGEKWGRLNRRGQLVSSWSADPDGAIADASYKNCPFAWSPRGWGVLVHTPAKVIHGVGFAQWSHRCYGLLVDDAVLDLFLITGTDGAEILERYTVLTGRPGAVPLWSLGVWHGWSPAEGPDGAADRLRADAMPGEVLVAEEPCLPDAEPEGAGRARDLGFRLCERDYALLSVADPLHADWAAKGWLVRDARTGQPYRPNVGSDRVDGSLVDLTHPDAFAHWRDRCRGRMAAGTDLLGPGIAGPIADSAIAANGDRGRRLHNVYALLHGRCLFEASRDSGRDRPVILGQAGWAGSQRHPVQRGGDPEADWEGLAASLRGALSWGLSGGPYYAVDLGGDGDAPPEDTLHVRWLQAAIFGSHLYLRAFGPVFGDATREAVSRLLDLRYQLLPYIEGTLAEVVAAGLPVMRAMPLAFPTESEGWAFDTQFMFGPDMLIVPVVTPDGRVRAYLPRGNWVDFWTDEQVAGGRRLDLVVPDDHIPVFVREGAVLPFGPSIQTTGELDGQTRIERLVIYGTPRHAPCLARHSITVLGDRLSGVPEGVVMETIGS